MSWPLVLPNQIIVGDPTFQAAILTGWTRRDRVASEIPKGIPYAAIGNIYTQERGVDMLIRNLLASPTIFSLILVGKDLTGVYPALKKLKGVSSDDRFVDVEGGYTVPGTKILVRNDIPKMVVIELMERINLYEPSNLAEAWSILAALQGRLIPPPQRKPCLYPAPEPEAEIFPAPPNVHPIRAKTIPEAYLELLYQIMTFGTCVDTHYDQKSLELMNLVTIVTEQDPNDLNIPEFIPFDREHLIVYRNGLLSTMPPPDGVTYLYGHRMRAHFGTDQLSNVAKKLAKDPDSRSAVVSLWDPKQEMPGSPCLNHIWFRIRRNKIHATLTIRSNDMLYGWPENAYGFRYVQEQVRGMILNHRGAFMDTKDLVLGDMVINSQSAHIYMDGWEHARALSEKYRKVRMWQDEKGIWIVDRENGLVKIELSSPDGRPLTLIRGTPTQALSEITKRRLVSDVGHALWLGFQLGRLEDRS